MSRDFLQCKATFVEYRVLVTCQVTEVACALCLCCVLCLKTCSRDSGGLGERQKFKCLKG